MTPTTHTGQLPLGRVGISLDLGEDHLDAAREYEQLGFSALWIPGGQLPSLGPLVEVMRATSRAVVAPSIASLDVHSVEDIRSAYADGEGSSPGRLMLGLGGPQRVRVGALQAMRDALDALDVVDVGVPRARRLLAALGPRKLDLARTRFAGAITLLTTPDHTRSTRGALAEATLVVHQMAVLERDPDRARTAARAPLGFLAGVPGYATNFRRMGFSEKDVRDLSDRLVDAVVVWGGVERIAERIAQHRSAGADHVVVSLLRSEGGTSVREAARRLAPIVIEA